MRILAALMLAAVAGLVGDVITIHPLAGSVSYLGMACTHNDRAANFLSIAVSREAGTPASYSLRAAIVNPVAATAGPSTLLLSNANPFFEPSVAWNLARDRHLVIFTMLDATSSRQVMGLVLDRAGQPVGGTAPFAISGATTASAAIPRVACDGRDWTVAWSGTDSDYSPRIWARRVEGRSTNAVPERGSIVDIAQPTDSVTHVEIAFAGGTDALVIWSCENYDYSYPAVEGRTLGPTGGVGTSRIYTDDANEEDGSYLGGLALAGGDGTYLVGWGGFSSSSGYYALRTRPVDGAGTPIAPSAIIHDPPYGGRAGAAVVQRPSYALAWSPLARQYLASWIEMPNAYQFAYRVLAARLGPNGTSVLEDSIKLTTEDLPVVTSNFASMSVAQVTSTKALVQWYSGSIQGRVYDIAGLEAPPAPSAEQYRKDGATSIPEGGVTNETSFVVRATTGPAKARLEVEVAPVGTAFTGRATTVGDFVPAGTPVALPVAFPGLALGRAYHWQVRAVDVNGLASFWVSRGTDPDDDAEVDLSIRSTNADPTTGIIGQRRSADGLVIDVGRRISGEPSISIRGTPSDADGDDVRLEVELQRVGRSYTGTPTAVGSWTPAGTPVDLSVPVPGYEEGGAWRWRARVVDSLGGVAAWSSFGGNDEDAADFEFPAFGSTGPASCLGSAASSPLLIALLALVLAAGRRFAVSS